MSNNDTDVSCTFLCPDRTSLVAAIQSHEQMFLINHGQRPRRCASRHQSIDIRATVQGEWKYTREVSMLLRHGAAACCCPRFHNIALSFPEETYRVLAFQVVLAPLLPFRSFPTLSSSRTRKCLAQASPLRSAIFIVRTFVAQSRYFRTPRSICSFTCNNRTMLSKFEQFPVVSGDFAVAPPGLVRVHFIFGTRCHLSSSPGFRS